MSYVVLARKYRPRSFDQMVGQEHVVQALTNALQQQRLHHAYLFTGTRGIGKTTVSRILAKSLNCTGPDGQGGITAHPCGRCSACIEIDADRYIDYIELDAASNRGIDEIRDLLERAAYKPSVGRFKVFMIDEAHQLTKESFNALLKTLEEPPEYLKFVLATTDPERMLPTVLSRCLQFNLRPMAPEVVQAHLETVLKAEGVAHDAGALRLLSRAARGSMRDALSLTDQAIAYGSGQLTEATVRTMLGSVDRSHATTLVRALAERNGPGVLEAIDALRMQGLSAAGTLEEIASLLQQMAIEQAVPGALDAHDPDAAEARTLASMLPPDETQLLYSLALHGRGELSLASDEYGALTMVLLRLLAFAPGEGAKPGSAALQAGPRVARAQAPLRPATPLPAPAAAVAKPAPRSDEPPPWLDEAPPEDALPPAREPIAAAVPAPVAAALQPTALGERWAGIVAQLSERGLISALVRELAMQSELVDAGAERWQLRVERESLRAPPLRDKLQAAVAAVLQPAPQLELVAGAAQDSPAKREAAAREQRQRDAEQIIRNDPLVQDVMAQFKTARIVPGSIKPV
jgi:DNA polymerase-3 subunit gamma/tau